MIITNNEEALRIKCDDVHIDEVNDLILKLESELDYANRLGMGGIGLAAPQIGIPKKIAIIRLGSSYDQKLNLINCKIEKGYDPIIFRNEGCLSFPGRIENTSRFQEVYVTNNLIYPYNFIASGLMAIVSQHEIDHFNNLLFMDRSVSKETSIKRKTGPNDPCICGIKDPITGKIKKFKKCCGK